MYIKIVCGKNRFYIFMSCHEFLKQYFFFKSFFLFSWHSGLPLHPNLMYTCNLYWRKMDTDIYLQYLHVDLSKKWFWFFPPNHTYTKSNPYHPYNARGNHSVRKVQDHFSCKNFDDLFHANRHHNFKEQL